MQTVDIDLPGRSIPLGKVMGGAFGDVFGWFTPSDPRVPGSDLDLQSNSKEVMEEVAGDLKFLGDIAFYVRWIGFIYSFIAIGIIFAKATFYTLEDIPWKPGTVGIAMKFVEAFRVVAIYAVLCGAVLLQAYLTDKSCKINVNNTVISTPMCEVDSDTCEFGCVTFQRNFSSNCTECNVRYNYW